MFQALIGPALSFGSSLISGLGARQSAKKQQKIQAAYEYQNYLLQERAQNYNRNITENRNAMMAGFGDQVLAQWNPANIALHADAAGFNPATWLGAMGGSYAAMQQYGYELKRPELVYDQPYMQNAPTAQVPSTMEAVGGALQAGVSAMLSDWRAADSRNFQREMLATQIAAVSANGGRPGSSMGVPASQRTFFGSGQIPYSVSAGSSSVTRLPPAAIDGSSPWKVGDVDVTNPFMRGGYIDPTRPDAGALENRYGDDHPIPWIGGWVTGWADLRRTWAMHADRNALLPDEIGLTLNPSYNDGARGVSWGLPMGGYNPGQLPGYGYSRGGQF